MRLIARAPLYMFLVVAGALVTFAESSAGDFLVSAYELNGIDLIGAVTPETITLVAKDSKGTQIGTKKTTTNGRFARFTATPTITDKTVTFIITRNTKTTTITGLNGGLSSSDADLQTLNYTVSSTSNYP